MFFFFPFFLSFFFFLKNKKNEMGQTKENPRIVGRWKIQSGCCFAATYDEGEIERVEKNKPRHSQLNLKANFYTKKREKKTGGGDNVCL